MITNKIKNLVAVTSIAAAALLSPSAFGEDGGAFFGKKAAGKWVIGAKAVNIDPNAPNVDDSRGVGIVVGYEFDTTVGYGSGKSSFEIEYIQGDKQEFTLTNPTTYEANVLNAFFSYRSPGTVYYKLKGGLSYVDIDVVTSTALFDDFEETSFALGGGLGVRIGDYGVVELEYTQDTGDSDLGLLSLNGLLNF
ncbi:MAG: outer membrane beta-barrel protein [Gammaproteobacteria bacterium]|nr:outer membrane beta-barrel protein [Gammaproteobacteria bacterium]